MKSNFVKILIAIIILISLIIGLGRNLNNRSTKDENVSAPLQPFYGTYNGIIRIGAVEYSPYYQVTDKAAYGPVVEIIDLAFNEMNVQYEFHSYPWNRLIEMAKSGHIDIVIDIYHTKEREEYLAYSSENLIKHKHSFFKLSDSNTVFNGDLNELSGKRIGVIRGYYYGEDFHNSVKENILFISESPDRLQNIEQLINERVDLIIDVVEPCNAILKEKEYAEIVIPIEQSVYEIDSYLGFSKINKLDNMSHLYDEVIRKMKNDGTYEEIFSKHGFNQ